MSSAHATRHTHPAAIAVLTGKPTALRATRRVLAVSVVGLLLAAPASRSETPDSDPRAIEIAEQVMTALGGWPRWHALVGLRWTFESAVGDTVRPGRRHVWNMHTGWHRVEGKTRQGVPFVFVDHLDTGKGWAWMNGAAMEGDTVPKLVRRSKSLWTNDSYWMLMPYKLRDPGVRLGYAGDTTVAGVTCDRLALTFEQVGETPGDRYWVHVNRANHRVEKWEHVLQGDQPPPEVWTWEGWEEHAGLWFPTVHRNGDRTIYTRAIETVGEFPAATFTAP